VKPDHGADWEFGFGIGPVLKKPGAERDITGIRQGRGHKRLRPSPAMPPLSHHQKDDLLKFMSFP
jgi:hypothetical protein